MNPGWESVDQWLAENHALVPDGEGWRDKDCPMDHIPEPCPVCNALAKARADERERIADLLQMKFSMTSARSHGDCACVLCAINSTVDAAVDWLGGGESDG